MFFLSGDVHFGEMNVARCPAVGYPLYDVTSSGLTHSWGGPIKATAVEIMLMGITRVPGVPYYTGKNWGEVDVQWADRLGGEGGEEGLVNDPNATRITFRLLGVDDGAVVAEHSVLLRELHAQADLTGGGSSGGGQPATVHRATALACTRENLTSGLTHACAAVLASCEPHITRVHEAKYYVGHAVIITGFLGVMGVVATAPCLAWVVGPFLPGGRATAAALVVGGWAVFASFIHSIH